MNGDAFRSFGVAGADIKAGTLRAKLLEVADGISDVLHLTGGE